MRYVEDQIRALTRLAPRSANDYAPRVVLPRPNSRVVDTVFGFVDSCVSAGVLCVCDFYSRTVSWTEPLQHSSLPSGNHPFAARARESLAGPLALVGVFQR